VADVSAEIAGPILFVGDSITDSDRASDRLGLGSGYVDVIATALHDRGDTTPVINTGISGNRVAHLSDRWQRDVLDHAPTTLTIFIGVNDTLVTFYEGRPTDPAAFEAAYVDLLERTAAAGISRLIVIEPFFIDSHLDDTQWREGAAFARDDLDLKRPIVRRLAERFGATLIPLQNEMDAAVRDRGPLVAAPDGVHPSPFGHRLIARLWLETYDELS
jgi:acyl-CoA thioesterase-1